MSIKRISMDPRDRVEAAHQAAQRAGRGDVTPEPYTEPGWMDQPSEVPTQEGWTRAIPSRLSWAWTTDFTAPVAAELDDWSASPRGRNLVVFGPLGVGKSHAAVAACRAGYERGMETVFLPAVELFELLRPGGPDGTLWDLMAVDHLVLDDLGAERPTGWTVERLYALINRRWLEERPTIVTTNLELPDLEEAIRPDTYSRLVGSGAVLLRLAGNDRRMVAP